MKMSETRRNEAPSSTTNTQDEEEVVPMARCEACGHMVPEPNMTIHKIHACSGVARAPPRNQADDEDDSSMDVEDESPLPTDTPSAVSSSAASPIDLVSPSTPSDLRQRRGGAVKRARDETTPQSQPAAATASRSDNVNFVDLSADSPERQPLNMVDLSNVNDTPQRQNDDSNNANSNEWACPKCTLLNSIQDRHCNACRAINPNAPPDPVRRERLVPGFSSPLPSSPSNMSYMSRGAILGGLVGAAGNFVRGRSVLEGGMNGAMSGAIGGAVLNDLFAASDRHSNSNRNQTVAIHSPSAPHHQNDMSFARSSAAMGTPGYPSMSSSSTRNSRSSTAHRPRSSYRVSQQTNPDGSTTTTISGGTGITRVTRQRGGMDDIGDPMINFMLHGMMEAGGGRYNNPNAPNVDGMDYEQLLQAFGDGSENLGAQEGDIRQLPTKKVQNPETELPEDARQCLICLDDFSQGDTRMILPCLHGFHDTCAKKWLRTNGSCPICKHRIR